LSDNHNLAALAETISKFTYCSKCE